MPLSVSKCDLTDGPTIAAIHTSTTTPFLKHQYGSASIDVVRDNFCSQYTDILARIQRGGSEDVHLKVVDQNSNDGEGTKTTIAWAHWILPLDESAPKPSGALRTQYGPPPGINLRFCGIASRAIEAMRTEVLQGKKCYMLNQLFTLPEHQRRGAGSMLLTWPFEDADKDGMVCYLDTEADGKVIALYEKHGYVKVAECEIPLEACGLEGFYTHVAMVREPKAVAGEVKRVERS